MIYGRKYFFSKIHRNTGETSECYRKIRRQLTGFTSAVYTQSISQIVPTFDGEPSQFKNWIKGIEKCSILTKANDFEIPNCSIYNLSRSGQ